MKSRPPTVGYLTVLENDDRTIAERAVNIPGPGATVADVPAEALYAVTALLPDDRTMNLAALPLVRQACSLVLDGAIIDG